MKIIKVIDEDTLEIRDEVVKEDEGITTKILEEDETIAVANLFRQALDCEPEDFANKYKAFKEAKAEFDKVYEPFKKNLIELHKTNPDLPSNLVIGSTVKLTYVSPSVRNTIDSKKLKEEEPELAKKFIKTSNVSATIRLEEI